MPIAGALERLEEEETSARDDRRRARHRSKTTVYRLMRCSHRIRPYPEIGKTSNSHAIAWQRTDDSSSERWPGRTLRELLLLTLAPYDTSRLKLRLDEDVLIPPKPATILALMLHELATNAAKALARW